MKTFKKMLSLVLALVLSFGVLGGVQLPQASAAENQSLAQLLNAGAIKPLGRTEALADGSGILTVWSGSGFEMNAFFPAESTLTVGYEATHSSYWAVLVDGQQVWRGLVANGTGTFSATVPYGKHTISVIKESQIDWSTTVSQKLTTVAFTGTLQAAPAQKDLYIEFIGDSYSCGDGAAAEYVPGVKWGAADNSATSGFPWYVAQTLDADYSIVARGGIGLFDGTSAQEGTKQTTTMTDIYANTAGFNSSYGTYDFARQPDIVVVELGANDGISSSDSTKTIANWQAKLEAFLTLVREKNPNSVIVMVQHSADKYEVMKALADGGKYGEAYACFYSHHGNGSAALDYQKEGHPSAADHQEWAKTLVNFMRYNNLLNNETEPVYRDIVYYVSETGNNSKDGKTLENALLTIPQALTVAKSGNTFVDGDRVVIRVKGTVVGTTSQIFGGNTTLRTESGKSVPVLITTHDYDAATDNKAVVKIDSKPAADGAGANYCVNDLWFQNVELKAIAGPADANGKTYSVYNFFASAQNLTFDNVEFTNDGLASNKDNLWNIGGVNFARGNGVENAVTTEKHGTVTFLNGDYTGLGIVAAVYKDAVYVSGGDTNLKSLPYYHAKLVIGEGAKMGTIYNRYGTMQVASATVEINGGEVAYYYGTKSGAANAYRSYSLYTQGHTPEMKLVINSGLLHGLRGTGDYVNYTGNIDTVMTGGKIETRPTQTRDNVYFAGGSGTNITGNVTNTISGGEVYTYSTAAIETMIVFGGDAVTINGTMTNRISGGTFAIFKGAVSASTVVLHFGSITSSNTPLLRNEITGGTFYVYSGGFYMGGRALKSVYGKIENVIGTKDVPSKSPRFLNGDVFLGGNWGQIGTDTYCGTAATQPTAISDTVVLSNTVYGGYFGKSVYSGVSSGTNTEKGYFEYIKGSIENNIYGGYFMSHYFGGSKGCVLGKVTTNVYGGKLSGFFGGAYGKILDGVEVNVYALEDLQICENKKPETQTKTNFYFHVGNASGGSITATTAGRPAAKLVFAPENPTDITFYRTINMGAGITGTKLAQLEGGYFPEGLKVANVTVVNALADGSHCFVDGAVVTPTDTATTVTGAVTVKPVPAMVGESIYESLEDALKDATTEQPAQLGKDTQTETLRISSTKKLDINGNTLTAADLLSFGHFVDSSNGKGLLKISNDPEHAALILRKDNEQIPVYDTASGGYRFYDRQNESLGNKAVVEGAKHKFGFRLLLPTAADYALLKDAKAAGITVEVTVKVGDRLNLTYEYSSEMVSSYATRAIEQLNADGAVKVAFTLTVSGLGSVQEGEVVTITPRAVTDTGVVMEMPSMTWTPAQ